MIEKEESEFKRIVVTVSGVIESFSASRKNLFKAEIRRLKEDEKIIREITKNQLSKIVPKP